MSDEDEVPGEVVLAEAAPGGERTPKELRGLVLAAATCAAIVLAAQLAGKAARDAIFLETFKVGSLPLLLAVSSTLAIGTTLVYARRITKGVPMRVVQGSNLVSAALLVIEFIALPLFPRTTTVVVYMHQTLIGPILVSGFWSVVSECFDPRTARRVLGTVGTGATIGAVIGAVIAERVAAMAGTRSLLLAIAALQLLATWRIMRVGRATLQTEHVEGASLKDTLHNLTRVSLLRRLAGITILVTIAAALLDYVFKAAASQRMTGDDLARLFALFHGVVGIATALTQWLLGRFALEKLGLARTLASLPGAVIVFGMTALAAPGIGTFILLRGAENVLRNSLYREAYEVFYTPLLVSERRTTKTVIDVGVERLGDVIGGLSVIALLALLHAPPQVLIGAAVGVSIIGVIVALKAQRSYVEALERSLLAHADELDNDDPGEKVTRSTIEMIVQRDRAGASASMSLPQMSRSSNVRGTEGTGGASAGGQAAPVDQTAPPSDSAPDRGHAAPRDDSGNPPVGASGRGHARKSRPPAVPERGAVDPTLARLTELVSGDLTRIKAALHGDLLSPAAVAYAIPLLARADVVASVRRAIGKVAAPCLGQLVDAVRDPLVPLAARVEISGLIAGAVLEQAPTPELGRARAELARAGLTACLDDSEFEVRYRAGAALGRLREHLPDLAVDAAAVFEGVRRELNVDPAVWTALDDATTAAQDAAESGATGRVLSRAAQHLATLLALALPAEPARTAFQALWSEDKAIRGVALEYLDNVLPQDIRERMWLVLELEAHAEVEEEAPPGDKASEATPGDKASAATPADATPAKSAPPKPSKSSKRPVEAVLADLLKRPTAPIAAVVPPPEARATQVEPPPEPRRKPGE